MEANMKLITTCCGRPIEDCPGCPGNMQLVPESEMDLGKRIGIKWEDVAFTKAQFEKGVKAEMEEHHDDPETKVITTDEEAGKVAWAHLKEDPKYYDKLAKIESNLEESHFIFNKIKKGVVTVEDFNKLIIETTPEAIRDRVRRRMKEQNSRKHLDDEGHQKTELPTFADRVQPKREREGRTQMNGRGKQAHRQSTRTQRRKATLENVPFRFREGVNFVYENIGKPVNIESLAAIKNFVNFRKLVFHLMTKPNVNRDWLNEVAKKCDKICESQNYKNLPEGDAFGCSCGNKNVYPMPCDLCGEKVCLSCLHYLHVKKHTWRLVCDSCYQKRKDSLLLKPQSAPPTWTAQDLEG
jgi:hypothetical protein